MGIAFENEYGYGYGFLKPVPDCVPDLLVKRDQNTVKFKNKYLAWNSKALFFSVGNEGCWMGDCGKGGKEWVSVVFFFKCGKKLVSVGES